MSLLKLQTWYILRRQEEHHLLVHTATPSLEKCCFVPNHLVLIQHLLKGEAAIGMRWHITYRLGSEG